MIVVTKTSIKIVTSMLHIMKKKFEMTFRAYIIVLITNIIL